MKKPRAAKPSAPPKPALGLSFQDVILNLSRFWAERGCVLQQPYDIEVGAGTMAPETFFRVLGSEPYRVAYVQPSRRPADGRYGENPNRLYKHTQLQVILKPAPDDVQQVYLESLEALGIPLRRHDIRFYEDNWEAPTLGAWGIGWEVRLDGLEITQFTYFQQCGGLDLDPVSVELTYGLERIAAFLQKSPTVFDLNWGGGKTYGQMRLEEERQLSAYSFDQADTAICRKIFELSEQEARRLLGSYPKDAPTAARLKFPLLAAYEFCLKCSHLFNVLDARGAISTTERAALIGRIRTLACQAAALYLDQKSVEGARA
ncbi:MAG TPA: glycine--tRNA ligase subunit alpha [Candidatus Xenobia bacterium]|nr:glycine--tRNA ligase subunit alpha [Candidatus Xenobia bacterium]